MRRVVVTGVGCVSALGDTAAELWSGMKAGRSGIVRLERYRDFPVSVFAPVAHDTRRFVEDLDPTIQAKMTRPMRMLFAAVREALAHSELRARTCDTRIGLIAGTTANYEVELLGEATEAPSDSVLRYFEAAEGDRIDWARFSQRSRYSPDNMLRHMSNLLTCVPAGHFGLMGFNQTLHNACATGSQAVGAAFQLVKHGRAEAVLAGGVDALVDWAGITAMCRLGVLSPEPDPARASRPFDAKRNGMVLGEGAGVLAIESLDNAQRRGAPVLAEILGFGSTANAYRITDSPVDGEAASWAIRAAVREAGIEPNQIDAISAHGTSTTQNDLAETHALKRALGDVATRVPTMIPKAVLGHALSGAGAIELVAAIRVLETGYLPGARSYTQPDPECDLQIVSQGLEKPVRYLLKNSFGFGGQNGALVLERWGGSE